MCKLKSLANVTDQGSWRQTSQQERWESDLLTAASKTPRITGNLSSSVCIIDLLALSASSLGPGRPLTGWAKVDCHVYTSAAHSLVGKFPTFQTSALPTFQWLASQREGRAVRKLGSTLARHTGIDESESINHLMTCTSIFLQKGLSDPLLNRIPNHPQILLELYRSPNRLKRHQRCR